MDRPYGGTHGRGSHCRSSPDGCVRRFAQAGGTSKITVVADWRPGRPGAVLRRTTGLHYKEGLEVEIIAGDGAIDQARRPRRADFSMTYVPDIMAARDTGIPVIPSAPCCALA